MFFCFQNVIPFQESQNCAQYCHDACDTVLAFLRQFVKCCTVAHKGWQDGKG